MKTFEEFFKDNGFVLTEGTVGYKQGLRGRVIEGDYSIRILGLTEEGIVGYIHPTGRSGNTVNFVIKDNYITIKEWV